MEEIVSNIVETLKNMADSQNIIVSLSFGFSLVVIESILPILPLAVFIALNCILFGTVTGFIMSWIGTVCGCILSYTIFRKGFSKKLYKNLDAHYKTKKIVKIFKNMSLTKLVIIMAIPFTPAFSINIGAGLSKMSFKKFFFALLIAKLSTVYFWGFVGTTLVESMTDIGVLVKLCVILVIAFLLSKFVVKKFNIE